jgi:hypothetical protein
MMQYLCILLLLTDPLLFHRLYDKKSLRFSLSYDACFNKWVPLS